MKHKLDFEHFIAFCRESASGVSDVSLQQRVDTSEPALEAVREYFKKHRIRERGMRAAGDDLQRFAKTYQIKEFYEKIYMADG